MGLAERASTSHLARNIRLSILTSFPLLENTEILVMAI
jgi:hypothetical protein